MVSKSLIAFFSRKGFNYANGGIINLPVGNTEIVAHKIQLLTGGETTCSTSNHRRLIPYIIPRRQK